MKDSASLSRDQLTVSRGRGYPFPRDPGNTLEFPTESNDVGNVHAQTVTVLPLTSSVDKVYPFEVLLKQGAYGGWGNPWVYCRMN